MIKDENNAKYIYTKHVEKVDKQLGYSLTAKKTKSGWLVFKWYQRNNWTDDKLERKVLIKTNGDIMENHGKIGSF